MGDYHIEDIYQGGFSSLNPERGSYGNFTGYRIAPSYLGLATDPRTANVLQEISTKLQSGAKQMELSTIQPEVFESIPKQHFEELNRLSKLTGVDISMHAPLVEPSGLSQSGFSEFTREEAERQMISATEKSHIISPDGNVPVTFHSSVSWQGSEYKRLKEGEEKGRIPVINQETGQVSVAQKEMRYVPGKDVTAEDFRKGIVQSAEEQVDVRNDTDWSNSITNLVAIKERADRMIGETEPIFNEIRKKLDSGIGVGDLTPTEKDVYLRYNNAGLEVHDIHKHLNLLFERAYKYGDNEQKENLIKLSESFRNSMPEDKYDFGGQSRAIEGLMYNLSRIAPPELYKPLEEFATDKTAETFANVAFNSYQKFKDNSPIISIENPPVGGGLSRAEDLKNVVTKAREKFVEMAMEKEGMNKSDAQAQANKLIGVTWDVGHINMLRKYGYSEQDVVKESEKIAPLLKHIHLSDNFGFEHTELPMGMGNVPIKDIMEKLGQKGFDAKKIIEAGNWWQHFKTSPFQESLEAFGSPIYGMKMQPYWNQSVGVQGYFGGYGEMLPSINYETMGSGFSMLPSELGGQRPGARGSRMTGRPLE